METAGKETGRSGAGAGWFARRSLAVRLFVATSAVTVIVMVIITAIMAWQSRQAAIQTVHREMTTALAGVDQSLQLVFSSASERGRELIPVLTREFGGTPVPDGNTLEMDEGGEVPIL
ncbi:MAG TPA: hypothetical protein VNQ97_04610, partial [Burkholderiaceae bacterium]|nr:hypothetical protein [Burkholderiaceae bacterium]